MARAKQNLASMSSLEALISLREKVGQVLRQRTEELRRQLQRLEIDGWTSRGRAAKRGTRKGQKVPPKYRDPENPSNVWAGRGAIPRWMAEKIMAGAKREDFLIGARGAATRKKRPGKKVRKATRKKTQRRAAKTTSSAGERTMPR